MAAYDFEHRRPPLMISSTMLALVLLLLCFVGAGGIVLRHRVPRPVGIALAAIWVFIVLGVCAVSAWALYHEHLH